MEQEELIRRLLADHSQRYDVAESFLIGECIYDGYASFNVTNSKYVLSKKAELWRANCFEHSFFRGLDTLQVEDLETFRRHIEEVIEPEYVRGGNAFPPPDHMYTFITGMFVVSSPVTAEVKSAVKRFHYSKNYLLTVRGYCDARVVVFDLANGEIFGNSAAKDIVKGYKKARYIS